MASLHPSGWSKGPATARWWKTVDCRCRYCHCFFGCWHCYCAFLGTQLGLAKSALVLCVS